MLRVPSIQNDVVRMTGGLLTKTDVLVVVQVIVWLWEVVHELAPENQRKYLKFVSGSDRAPIGGLANLRCLIQVRRDQHHHHCPLSHVASEANALRYSLN